MVRKQPVVLLTTVLSVLALALSVETYAKPQPSRDESRIKSIKEKRVTAEQRKEAAKRFWASFLNAPKAKENTKAPQKAVEEKEGVAITEGIGTMAMVMPMPDPNAPPHYFGPYPNWAYSPLPKGAITAITVIDGGTGYVAPTVEVIDLYGTGSGATATATVTAGAITGIVIGNGGTGYSAPVVMIRDTAGNGAAAEASIGGTLTGGIRKFVDKLPGLGESQANARGQYIPVAVADTTSFPATATAPAADYYEIAVVQYKEKMHADLPATLIRGYVQLETPTNASVSKHIALTNTDGTPIRKANGSQAYGVDRPHYMGPVIVSRRDRPVRVKFYNLLPTGAGGDLFIPVDTTAMGAGMGPYMMTPPVGGMNYTQNRANVHLHGNNTVWISDGTPHQWVTPAGEVTSYPKGVSVYNVPDMPAPEDGAVTLYYTNAHSARLMFYHDHSYGITRLNVYAGEAAGYVVTDTVEQDLIAGTNNTGVNPGLAKVLPDLGIPLVIQDKTFVDASTIMLQDPTWRWGSMPGMPMTGDLWMPHVYVPAQNPYDITGANPFGRWHYAAWFWPPATNLTHGPIPNPYYDPIDAPWEPPEMPATPNPSMPGEAFMDTPVVNGAAYPYMEVEPKAYRFRVLNACNDRFVNLQLYVADPAVTTLDGRANTEVKMVPANATPGFPAEWPADGRAGGVPDPATAGPSFIQIGTEGGFLPAPTVVDNQPIAWNMNPTTFNFGNVSSHALLLGTAERADVIIDFSAYAGKTLILYNDAPAAFPALDSRYDYYTGNPNQTDSGGSPSTLAGYGPNIRTIMQIRVAATAPAPAYDLNTLNSVFAKTAAKRGVFEVSQDEILVPQSDYNSAYNLSFPNDAFARIQNNSLTFKTVSGSTVTIPLEPKAIQDEMGEAFDTDYGRMSGMLGVELPFTASGNQNFILYGYASPPVEIVKESIVGTPLGTLGDGTQFWKITHNGVDTHTIHTHLYNAQLINRVAWDGAISRPDPNELGWKETFRVNPLEDTIVAFRQVRPQVPFKVPNSVRLLDPTMPEGEPLMTPPGGFFDPLAQPVTINNHYVNFGWEYVYHCHLLAHEEMDMMHAVSFCVAPEDPSGLTATRTGSASVKVDWVDNSLGETGFTVERAADAGFTSGLVSFPVDKNITTFTDTSVVSGQTYSYRVFASNVVGDTQDYGAQSLGFPRKTANSGYSNTATIALVQVPGAPVNLTATASAQGVTPITVRLNWQKGDATAVTAFLIERRIGNGAYIQVARISGTLLTWTDSAVSQSTTYTYRVRASNTAGNSNYSNLATVTTSSTATSAPAAPSNLRVTGLAGTYVILAWNDNSNNETGFQIRRAPTVSGPWTTITTTGANVTSYRNSGLISHTTYYYQVRSTNGIGSSAWVPATPVSATTN